MPRQTNRTQEITCNITQRLGILDTSQTGWTKEVNLVEWNGKPAKLDIREWDPEHEHMSRGITLHKHETLALLEILLRNFGKDLARSRSFASESTVPAAEPVVHPVNQPAPTAETAMPAAPAVKQIAPQEGSVIPAEESYASAETAVYTTEAEKEATAAEEEVASARPPYCPCNGNDEECGQEEPELAVQPEDGYFAAPGTDDRVQGF